MDNAVYDAFVRSYYSTYSSSAKRLLLLAEDRSREGFGDLGVVLATRVIILSLGHTVASSGILPPSEVLQVSSVRSSDDNNAYRTVPVPLLR